MFTPKHLAFSVSEAKRKQGIYCCAYGCRNSPNRKKKGMCGTHWNRHRQQVDPVYTRYEDFKYNALKRHKEFTITLKEFRKFCADNGYIITKGCRGRAASIDRKDNRFGYHIWNIQLMTAISNTRKYYDHDRYMDDDDFNTNDLPF